MARAPASRSALARSIGSTTLPGISSVSIGSRGGGAGVEPVSSRRVAESGTMAAAGNGVIGGTGEEAVSRCPSSGFVWTFTPVCVSAGSLGLNSRGGGIITEGRAEIRSSAGVCPRAAGANVAAQDVPITVAQRHAAASLRVSSNRLVIQTLLAF